MTYWNNYGRKYPEETLHGSVVYVEGDAASGDEEFADTLQRTLGDLARSSQDIQVSVLICDVIRWHFLVF